MNDVQPSDRNPGLSRGAGAEISAVGYCQSLDLDEGRSSLLPAGRGCLADALVTQQDIFRAALAYERAAAVHTSESRPAPDVGGDGQRDGGVPDVRGLVPSAEGGWADFERGFLEGGGPAWQVAPFIATLSCEGSQWSGYYGQNGYWTRAQFSLGTWNAVTMHFIEYDADDPHFVGLAVAWWSQQVSDISDQWPTCSIGTGLP